MKKYLAMTLACIVSVGSITVMASTAKKIDAYYTVKKLVVNGVDTGKGSTAFISEGTTYVPLRTVADALGAEIGFDKDTMTVVINTTNADEAGMPQDLPIINNSVPPVNNVVPPVNNVVPPINRGFIAKDIKVTDAKARDIALKKTGGGTVIKCNLDDAYYDGDDDYDIPNYDIKIQKGFKRFEIEVNAITGEILKYEIDD